MHVERFKFLIWAADLPRAAAFYTEVFGGEVVRRNAHVTEMAIADGILGIHGGGEGKRTWTGLNFQVADVVAGAAEVVAAGGTLAREPQPENDEPPHLAMCVDPDGNEFMLSRKRS